MTDIKRDFVANLAVMTLSQFVSQAEVIVELEAEAESLDSAQFLRLQRDCVDAVGKLRFGPRYEDALRKANLI